MSVPAVLALLAALTAQDSTVAAPDSTLRVFFDCQGGGGCDFDFMRTEITFVNWVRQREDAHVHLLITAQQTGGGGREHTLAFIGLRQFRGRVDTLRYFSHPTDTDDEVRRGLVKVIKLGLVAYVAKTPEAQRLTISYIAPAGPATARARDPWNYWFFRLQLNGNLRGERRSRSIGLFGNLSANRVTEAWKFQLNIFPNYNEDRFVFFIYDSLGNVIGEDTVTSASRNYGSEMVLVRSLTGHWSVGGWASVRKSTRSNYDLAVEIGPAIEFDLYPYGESTRRLFTLTYGLAVKYNDYTDTTVYNRTSETRLRQSLISSVKVIQPWGSIDVALTGSTYLHNLRLNSVELFGEFDVRVLKGLSVNAFGSIERVRDQINLSKADAPVGDVFLGRRELETTYRYFTFFGLRYSFGSTYNNIVNRRFDVF